MSSMKRGYAAIDTKTNIASIKWPAYAGTMPPAFSTEEASHAAHQREAQSAHQVCLGRRRAMPRRDTRPERPQYLAEGQHGRFRRRPSRLLGALQETSAGKSRP